MLIFKHNDNFYEIMTIPENYDNMYLIMEVIYISIPSTCYNFLMI